MSGFWVGVLTWHAAIALVVLVRMSVKEAVDWSDGHDVAVSLACALAWPVLLLMRRR